MTTTKAEDDALILQALELLSYYHGYIEGVTRKAPPQSEQYQAIVDSIVARSMKTP